MGGRGRGTEHKEKREPVPWILRGQHEDWPEWLDGITEERWNHILERHAPNSISDAPHFDLDTNIGNAIFDTITEGELAVNNDFERRYAYVVNNQEINVAIRPKNDGSGWYVTSAHPRE